MAKELPFFKFEPSEWDNGNIQCCNKSSKGLFIDICSMYWVRLGELPYALALQKLCNGNENELQDLIQHDIIQIENNHIIVKFLDEQLAEFSDIRTKRQDAANKRWNAKAMQKQCKSNAIRGEEKREEKKRKEKIFIAPTLEEVKQYFDENGFSLESAERAFKYYSCADWYDSKGNKVRSWKQKMQSVWFTPDNKKQPAFRMP